MRKEGSSNEATQVYGWQMLGGITITPQISLTSSTAFTASKLSPAWRGKRCTTRYPRI